MLKRLTLEQFHGDERAPMEFTNVIDGADIRMIQRGCGPCLAPESLDGQ